MFFGKLTDGEQRLRTMTSLAGVFERMMRIMTGRAVRTTVVDDVNKPYAAWTVQDGRNPDTVHFNMSNIGPLKTAADIVRVTGLAHHERCHISYTPAFPTTGNNPMTAVFKKNGSPAYHVFNILEDQRIESGDVARWPSSRHYYNAMIAGYILSGSEDEMKLAWLLVHGRRYLGQQIRDAMEGVFKYPEHVPEAKRIIDAYRVLNLFQYGDQAIAAALVQDMVDLLYTAMPEQPDYGHHAEIVLVPGSRAAQAGDKEGASQAAAKVRIGTDEKAAKDDRGDGSSSSSEDEDEDEDEDDKGQGPDSFDFDADDDFDDEGDGDDGDDGEGGSGEGYSNAKSGGGQGASAGGDPSEANPNAIHEMLKQIIQSAVTSEYVRGEIKRSMEAVRNNEHHDTVGGHHGWHTQSRPDTVIAAATLSRRLERMRAEMDPGWETHQDSGRLSVRRASAQTPKIDELFDLWQEGNTDAVDIETVLIADVSGSMSSYNYELASAMWSIKRGHDKIGASCTVFSFDDHAYLVWKARERAVTNKFPILPTTGGTAPRRALIESARILSASKRKRKMFIALTDGIWSDQNQIWDYQTHTYRDNYGPPANDIIAEMNGHNVLTAMVFLTGARDVHTRTIDWHNTQVHRTMSDLTEFAGFGDALVRRIMSTRTR